MIGRLIDGGLNIFRLNMSHATHEWVRRVVKDIRAAAVARNVCIGILMDTQGPAIRTGEPERTLTLLLTSAFSVKCVSNGMLCVNA